MTCSTNNNATDISFGGDRIFRTTGDTDLADSNDANTTVLVTGKAATETAAEIDLPECPKDGQTVKIVASGAPANADPGDTNTIAGGKSYTANNSTSTFTFVAAANPCDPGVWIPDCCATTPPVG